MRMCIQINRYIYMHMCAYADEVLGHMRGSEPPNPNQSKALNPTA